MAVETVKVELQTRFLYPGIILMGDAYDDNGKLIVEKDIPLTKDFIENLKDSGVKVISYKREKLLLKKNPDNIKGMIQDKSFEQAMNVVNEIRGIIRNKNTGLPVKEINEVANSFIKEIQNNEDAYLNLLGLFHDEDYSYTHSINVSTISILLGVSLKLDQVKLNLLGIAGLLHDIGKSLIPDEIVNKTSKLDDQEWNIMKSHPVFGYNIVKAEKNFDNKIEKAVLLHHETVTGKGYPFGVKSDNLDELEQIVTIADVFDAMTTEKSYKKAAEFNEAFSYLMDNSGIKFNPHYIQVFLRDMVKKINGKPLYNTGEYVLLNTGEIGWVVGHRSDVFTLRPIVDIFFNPGKGTETSDKFLRYPIQIDLEQDLKRIYLKKIIDQNMITKFNAILKKC